MDNKKSDFEQIFFKNMALVRRYLLLADGEFGRQLVVSLCQLGREIQEPAALAGQIKQHLTDGRPPPALLCPTALNRVLETAIAASLQVIFRVREPSGLEPGS